MRPTAVVYRAILVLVILLAGCASVPLATMVRMSRFNEKDFAALDANVIRARVFVDQGFEIDPDRSELTVELDSGDRSQMRRFGLTQERGYADVQPHGLLTAGRTRQVYILRLSEVDQRQFEALQAFVKPQKVDFVKLNVEVGLKSVPAGATALQLSLDLLLNADQGYLPLLEDASLPIGKALVSGSPHQ
jgi:hypothetical protein